MATIRERLEQQNNSRSEFDTFDNFFDNIEREMDMNSRNRLEDERRSRIISNKIFSNFFSKFTNFTTNTYLDIKDGISDGLGQVTSTINSSMNDVMGSGLNSLINDVKNIGSGFLKMGMGLWNTFGSNDEELEQEENQTKILTKIWNFFRRQETADAMHPEEDKTDDSWTDLLVFAGGALIGGITGIILKPFEVLYGTLKGLYPVFKGIEKAGSFIKGTLIEIPIVKKVLGFFGKIGSIFSKILAPITKSFRWLLEIFATASKSKTILGSLIRGVKWGFEKIAWPLTILMGLFDFITGFASEEGSLVEKFKAGFTKAVVNFFELPIQIIGWLVDKILGLFDIKIENGSAEKMLEWLRIGISKTIDIIIYPFEKLYYGISWLYNEFKDAKPDVGVFGKIKSFFSVVFEAILMPFKIIYEGLKFLWNMFTKDYTEAGKNLFSIWDIFSSTYEKVASFVMNSFISFFNNLLPDGWQIPEFDFDIVVKTFKDTFGNIFNWVKEKVLSISSKLNPLNWFSDDTESNPQKTTAVLDTVVSKTKDFFGNVTEKVSKILDGDILNSISKMFDFNKLKNLTLDINNMLGDSFDKMFNVFSKVIGKDFIDDFKDAFTKIFEDITKVLTEKNIKQNPIIIIKEAPKQQIPVTKQQESPQSTAFKQEQANEIKVQDKKENQKTQIIADAQNNQTQTLKQTIEQKETKTVESKIQESNSAILSYNESVTNRTRSASEIPDEIENFGIIFLNKSTLGPSL